MDRWGYHCDRRLSVGTFIVFEWVSPTGDYLLSGLLRFALRAFACKSWACRPWQARSPGQASTGRLAVSGSPTPVPRVPFFACPKKGTERKGTPDSAPANPAGPIARSLPQWVRARDRDGPSADPLRRLRREGQPAPFAGDGAGADGFGNFGRNQSSSSAGTRPG